MLCFHIVVSCFIPLGTDNDLNAAKHINLKFDSWTFAAVVVDVVVVVTVVSATVVAVVICSSCCCC